MQGREAPSIDSPTQDRGRVNITGAALFVSQPSTVTYFTITDKTDDVDLHLLPDVVSYVSLGQEKQTGKPIDEHTSFSYCTCLYQQELLTSAVWSINKYSADVESDCFDRRLLTQTMQHTM